MKKWGFLLCLGFAFIFFQNQAVIQKSDQYHIDHLDNRGTSESTKTIPITKEQIYQGNLQSVDISILFKALMLGTQWKGNRDSVKISNAGKKGGESSFPNESNQILYYTEYRSTAYRGGEFNGSGVQEGRGDVSVSFC